MNKLIELWDKPTIFWTNTDKYELIIELFKDFWWIIIPTIIILTYWTYWRKKK